MCPLRLRITANVNTDERERERESKIQLSAERVYGNVCHEHALHTFLFFEVKHFYCAALRSSDQFVAIRVKGKRLHWRIELTKSLDTE